MAVVTNCSRWADIMDSDEENSRGGLPRCGLGTVPEDCSYQGPGVAGLEASKDGLNAAFLNGAALDVKKSSQGNNRSSGEAKQTPKDFGFLLKESEEDDKAYEERKCTDSDDTSDPSLRSGRFLNPSAPDFIPTCNPEIQPVAVIANPMIMVLDPACHHSAFAPNHGGKRPPKAAESTKRNRVNSSGSLIGDGEGSEGGASIKGPDRKRSRSGLEKSGNFRRRGRGASFSDNASSNTTTPGTSTNGGLAHGEMQEATEEEWQQRAETRLKQIECGRATADYKLYLELVPKDLREPIDPMTPRHEDRVSKSNWKAQVQAWRLAVTDRVKGTSPAQGPRKEMLTIEGVAKEGGVLQEAAE